MIIKVINREVEGDLKVENKFAWLPKEVDGKVIWLHRYQLFYEYVVCERCLPYIRGMSKVYTAVYGSWDIKGEKIL